MAKQLYMCICGTPFRQRAQGRCPHCGLLIRRDGDRRKTTFERFLEMEQEAGRVGVVGISDDRQVYLFYWNPTVIGPKRYGWPQWFQMTTQEIEQLTQTQRQVTAQLAKMGALHER